VTFAEPFRLTPPRRAGRSRPGRVRRPTSFGSCGRPCGRNPRGSKSRSSAKAKAGRVFATGRGPLSVTDSAMTTTAAPDPPSMRKPSGRPVDRMPDLSRPGPGPNPGVNIEPGPQDDGWPEPPPVRLADGTAVRLLKDGQALRVAWEAIRSARESVALEIYIFHSDHTGRAFAELLPLLVQGDNPLPDPHRYRLHPRDLLPARKLPKHTAGRDRKMGTALVGRRLRAATACCSAAEWRKARRGSDGHGRRGTTVPGARLRGRRPR
jgi:hypothetical protein